MESNRNMIFKNIKRMQFSDIQNILRLASFHMSTAKPKHQTTNMFQIKMRYS